MADIVPKNEYWTKPMISGVCSLRIAGVETDIVILPEPPEGTLIKQKQTKVLSSVD